MGLPGWLGEIALCILILIFGILFFLVAIGIYHVIEKNPKNMKRNFIIGFIIGFIITIFIAWYWITYSKCC
jgi:high-affinity Fe2+/Pb2+ permease